VGEEVGTEFFRPVVSIDVARGRFAPEQACDYRKERVLALKTEVGERN
jgi:hypothetical protein